MKLSGPPFGASVPYLEPSRPARVRVSGPFESAGTLRRPDPEHRIPASATGRA